MYFSWRPNPHALAVDALSIRYLPYMFPSFVLINWCLEVRCTEVYVFRYWNNNFKRGCSNAWNNHFFLKMGRVRIIGWFEKLESPWYLLFLAVRSLHRPVERVTAGHWLKRIMTLAGVDADIFSARSSIGTCTSKASSSWDIAQNRSNSPIYTAHKSTSVFYGTQGEKWNFPSVL